MRGTNECRYQGVPLHMLAQQDFAFGSDSTRAAPPRVTNLNERGQPASGADARRAGVPKIARGHVCANDTTVGIRLHTLRICTPAANGKRHCSILPGVVSIAIALLPAYVDGAIRQAGVGLSLLQGVPKLDELRRPGRWNALHAARREESVGRTCCPDLRNLKKHSPNTTPRAATA